jgi:hypothetical protein
VLGVAVLRMETGARNRWAIGPFGPHRDGADLMFAVKALLAHEPTHALPVPVLLIHAEIKARVEPGIWRQAAHIAAIEDVREAPPP